MINIPLTIIIATFGIFITARFQRYHWLRSTREEIRVRETAEASELVREIAVAFDKRITAQRRLLHGIGSPDEKIIKELYSGAVREYAETFNSIKYRLFYYTSYQDVLDFESKLHNRIVTNAEGIHQIERTGTPLSRSSAELEKDLSILSAKVFHYCRNMSENIANEQIGSLRRLHDWKDPKNEFVTNWHLIRRLLNV